MRLLWGGGELTEKIPSDILIRFRFSLFMMIRFSSNFQNVKSSNFGICITKSLLLSYEKLPTRNSLKYFRVNLHKKFSRLGSKCRWVQILRWTKTFNACKTKGETTLVVIEVFFGQRFTRQILNSFQGWGNLKLSGLQSPRLGISTP